jgi:hypothetical protein
MKYKQELVKHNCIILEDGSFKTQSHQFYLKKKNQYQTLLSNQSDFAN